MDIIPEYKLKIFVDALQVHFDQEPIANFAEDELAVVTEDWPTFADEGGYDILADIVDADRNIKKGRRKIAQQKWRQSEAGRAASKAWNESKAGKEAKKAWNESEAGKAAKKAWNESEAGKEARKAWNKSDAGKAAKKAWYNTEAGQTAKQRENAANRAKTLDKYLNRQIVALDSEGRCPLHMINAKGQTPLEAYKETGCLKYLQKDSSGHYWEPHELSLIGAATINRPYGTPIEKGIWETPVWLELTSKHQSEQVFEFLLSLPDNFPNKPLWVMFSAMYDWSMWLRDTPYGKAFEIAKQRGFVPPCKRMRGMVFWKKYAIKVRPYFDFKLSELRWPDDPYGKNHTDDPAYQKPGKKQKAKLQVIRRITITDTFRLSPKSFVETIEPLMKRGLIPKDVFETIKREKQKRGGFHLEPMENVKRYCGYELHSLCCFMHMIRDACWTSADLRLKSFHSPAAIASELLKRINVRAHSWPVKSTDLEYEQEIAHWSYFGGRFEWVLKGYNKAAGYQTDLANAYPYAMQFLPSMVGGRWEKIEGNAARELIKRPKLIEQSCILSIYRVRFNFYADAPFYALPYRLPDSIILYPRMGYGYYVRDDVLNAIDWCRKFKIPLDRALIIEEANLFHPSAIAMPVSPFDMLRDIYAKRIEFDKRDPKGPEQKVLKDGMCSCYGKLAERRYRGDDPKTNEPAIPPHACPWYASAITAHTRRELMKAALIAPECVIGFATDAIYSQVLLDLPRLKAEADIKAGKEDKLLGDWCWSKIPGGVFIQSGMAFYLKDDGKVGEVKCRGLPVKNLEKAQKFLDDVLKAWSQPYNPKSVCDLKPKKKRPIARHASVPIHGFMPLTLAITSPDKFNKFFCKWGDVTKTIWLDDAGSKRDIDEEDLDLLIDEAAQTRPKENLHPERISAPRFPDWVENAVREKKRQEAAVDQYFKLDKAEFAGYDIKASDADYSGYYDTEDEDEIAEWMSSEPRDDAEFNRLLEANEDIEV